MRRLPWAGPEPSAAELGRSSAGRIEREALLAGRALRAGGVNVDLAPVADVAGAGSFLAAEERTFGSSPPVVGRAVAAFTRGLTTAGVAAGVKHFPGIGRAIRNTDRAAVDIRVSGPQLAAGLRPFEAAVAAGAPIVMVSNASYPELDPKPAAWSPRVLALLRTELGFQGVTITDALERAAATRGRDTAAAAVLSVRAGVDLLLLTGSEASTGLVFERLARAAESGRLPAASLQRSYERIIRLKRAFAGAVTTASPGR